MESTLGIVLLCVLVGALALFAEAGEPGGGRNLVANGSFEDADGDNVPDGWSSSGVAGMVQVLTVDDAGEGRKAGRLVCSKFVPGSPSSHAMLCQVGLVSVRKGQWYRLTWRAKGRGIKRNMVQLALSNTRRWSNAGLQHVFPVTGRWRGYERYFQATQDLPGESSRLQFWFGSTGTFWLSDVVLGPAEMRREYHPQISTEGVTNFIPNSSFECGAPGWGSYNPAMRTWAGNMYRLEGEIDETTASHGERSLRLHLTKGNAPRFMWDYFDPVDEEALAVVTAHLGWVPLVPGQYYSFSCDLKADRPECAARLMVRESDRRTNGDTVRVGTEWKRYSMRFRARTEFAWAGAGLDLAATAGDSATLWIDAVQFERGREATAYAPRSGVESFIETSEPGNVFLKPEEGLSVRVVACNGTDRRQTVRGSLTVTDFFDEQVLERDVSLPVEAGRQAVLPVKGMAAGRRGFFRVHWKPADGSMPMPLSLRCMLIDPYERDDSIFGMNHAYGWPFLLRLSKAAGLRWWRDWTVQWRTVEPEKGRFDFSLTDPQVDRVVNEDLNLLVMFPYASTPWCSTGDPARIKEAAGDRPWTTKTLTIACLPENKDDFRNYVARCVRHYRDRIRYYQVFNEPLYTHYSLPARLGYKLSDYNDMLRIAHEAVKSEQKDALVVGGIGIWAGSKWTRDFVESGALRWVDVLDLHNYPVTADPESYEEDIAEVERMMKARGQFRPMWLTEYGCYADDDPFCTPAGVGDAAMSRSLWPDERAASEALVQATAAFFTHGLRKIFFHAGTCGPINGANAGNVFFEYGGAPRKMLPAASALSNLLDPGFEPVSAGGHPEGMKAYMFRTRGGLLAICWTRGDPVRVRIPRGVSVRDIMGNELKARRVEITSTPVYLISKRLDPRSLKAVLTSRR